MGSVLYGLILFVFWSGSSFGSPLEQNFEQYDYDLNSERFVCTWYNTSIFDFIRVRNYKFKRTVPAVDLGVQLKSHLSHIEVKVEVLRYTLNEYVATSMKMQGNVCSMAAKNVFDFEALKVNGNFTNCPLNKGYYEAKNMTINSSKYPPNVPEGRWLFHMTFYIGDVKLCVVEWFAAVEYHVQKYRDFF